MKVICHFIKSAVIIYVITCLTRDTWFSWNLISTLCFCKGDWHQYDDIICVQPPKGVIKRLKNMFWGEQRKDLIQGRQIAGRIMLQGIFDLLREWTSINLTNFWTQLRQFFEIYADPFVFEETQRKWDSLGYGKDDVSEVIWNALTTDTVQVY